MGVHDQFPVGALLVLADARLDQRRSPEPREPVLHVLARLADALRRGRPVSVGGIEVGSAPVVRDLEAPEAGRRDAVERALDPGRELLLGQVGAARRGTEVEDLLPGGADERRVELREELREPRPAGEHEEVGFDHAAVREADLPHPATRQISRRRLRPPEAAACLLELPEHPFAASPGEQVAGVPFEHAVGEALRVDLGEAARQLVAVEFLDREAEFPEDRHRGLRVLVLPAPHPQHADGKEQPVVPARLVLLPDLGRPRHHRAVDPPRPVGGPDQPALAPRARAGVARPPRIHERHLGAHPPQPERRPAAEGPCPDHDRADPASGLRGVPARRGLWCPGFAGAVPAGAERGGAGEPGGDRLAAGNAFRHGGFILRTAPGRRRAPSRARRAPVPPASRRAPVRACSRGRSPRRRSRRSPPRGGCPR